MKFWIALLLAGCSSAWALPEADYVAHHALPMASLRPETGLTDLEPLGDLIGDSRLVAMGEGTHGTAEFTTARARLLEYLVKTKGFRLFALEASWAGSRALNAYVQGGPGDAKALLQRYARLAWPWRTQQMLETLQWLRAYNAQAAPEDRVRFSGFDLQDAVSAVDWVVEYLDAYSDQATRADELLGCIRFSLNNVLGVGRYTARGLTGAQACETSILTVRRIMENRRAALVAASGLLAYTEALHATALLEQESAYDAGRFLGSGVDAVAERDRFMAQNVIWLEQTYHQKVVLWAHNGHVTFRPSMAFGWKPLGAYLREHYGASYFVFASSFYSGSFNAQLVSADLARTLTAAVLGLAQNPSEQRVPAPESGSYEEIFHATGLTQFILPLRVPRDASSQWLWQTRRFYIVPQNLPPFEQPMRDWYSYDAVLPNEFDAVLYIEQSTPTGLL